jgi:hypothetical protein
MIRSHGFGGFDRDAISEGFDLAREASGVRIGPALLEPVRTEVDVGHASVEDVEGGDEHRVLDGLAGLRVAEPPAQTLELRAEGLQEGEQTVWWSVATRTGVRWGGAGEGSFLDAHVRMEVDPDGRVQILVAQPHRNHRASTPARSKVTAHV